ncbi:protein IQ-DOMAIN 17-like [Phragmites australis]|uniref:protein IQ-DOMAIN 17-like n=1 Tax=Phragmites australis TaxID=29695 RepID=UPI002D77857D|nr:protein IQ-DOMAIN 17-like [Phragmites australis]
MDMLRRLLCCLGTRHRQGQLRQRHDGRSGQDDARKGFLRAALVAGAARFSRSENVEQLETPTPRYRRWPRQRGTNRIFARSPPCGIAGAGSVEPRPVTDATATAVEEVIGRAGCHGFSRDHAAAATIQAHFRGHLARRALRALRSLVKLQAFARGSYVRKQANVAIRCMKVLVRLQVRVRARQLLSTRQAGKVH